MYANTLCTPSVLHMYMCMYIFCTSSLAPTYSFSLCACTYACVYVCLHTPSAPLHLLPRIHFVDVHVNTHACMYVCKHLLCLLLSLFSPSSLVFICIYACMYVSCMYVCMYIRMHVYMPAQTFSSSSLASFPPAPSYSNSFMTDSTQDFLSSAKFMQCSIRSSSSRMSSAQDMY